MADATNSTDSQNLFDRWLTPKSTPGARSDDPSSTLILGSDGWRPMAKPAKNPQADAEFQAALKLFQQGKFPEAEKQFAKIAKDRKGTHPGAKNAQYYLAETQYQRKKYVNAHDNFERLHKDYPGDRSTRQSWSAASMRSRRSGCSRTTPRPPRTSCFPGTVTSTAASP